MGRASVRLSLRQAPCATPHTYPGLQPPSLHTRLPQCRSTYPGSGAYAATWAADNNATWADLQRSIPAVAAAGMAGMPMGEPAGRQAGMDRGRCSCWVDLRLSYVSVFTLTLTNTNWTGFLPLHFRSWGRHLRVLGQHDRRAVLPMD